MGEPQVGKVFLIGAGPGDPGLLTLKGKAILDAADTVVYDRLAPEELLLDLPSHIRLIDAGKMPGNHPIPQEEINRILIDEARQGRKVVRLKGGDPFLFGRGGEELLALAAAGIPFEAVPGISSAIAVPAAAGIPVTHRGISSSLHILTWHTQNNAAPPPETLEAINPAGGTLVILMGGSALQEIGAALLRAGFAPDTPAVIIADGTGKRQRVRRLCLQEMAESPVTEMVPGTTSGAPVLVAVGAVCALADTLGTELAPIRAALSPVQARSSPAETPRDLSPAGLSLAGLRIVVTRPEPQNAETCQKIRAMGGRAIPFPCIKRAPAKLPPKAFEEAAQYQWLVFTSAAGVEIFFESHLRFGGDLRKFGSCRFAAVGPATADALAKRGFIADYVPEVHNGRSLGQGLAERVKPGEKVLLLRARDAHPELPQILTERGISFEDIAVYETIPAEGNAYARKLIEAGLFDFVYFSSGQGAAGFKAAFPDLDMRGIRAICFGESTASRARELGMEVQITEDADLSFPLSVLLD
ncbi:uroporphyrinogen-III C-methyltransferase [Spirochaetia bacterium]|nr:uroporphyrinogen-III C-methyltransferase [Spirochaetia bacterium]